MSNDIRVRIAPSPTGPLHIGTARTALFNWLFAKKNRGKFILRIEDTDIERSDPKFEEDIKESLKWLGLEWDELYKQSKRLETYKKHLQKLLDEDKAFWCRHTIEELKKESEDQMKRKEATRHICDHKHEKAKTGKGIIRLKVDYNSNRKIYFDDIIRGKIEWEEKLIGDLSLAKNLETPLYNFAVVVDDYETKISHVIRGEDHISNTPKQILIQEALGIKQTQYAHLPLILGPDRTKLSKRHGAESVNEYKKDYLPEAVVNFMGFLGYTYDKEILSKEEMIQEFEITKVHKSAAIFDMKKLNHINSQWNKKIIRVNPERIKEVIALSGISSTISIAGIIIDRADKISDMKEMAYLSKDSSDDLDYQKELLIWKESKIEDIKKSLIESKKIIEGLKSLPLKMLDDNNMRFTEKESLDAELSNLSLNFGGDKGIVYWPLRVALSGKEKSAGPIELITGLGKEKSLRRIENAIDKIG